MNQRIKKLRKELDLTQIEFANQIGMKQNTIATYEMGRTKPSDAAIKHICRTFNVNENWLRTGEGDMFIKLDKKTELENAIKTFLSSESESFRERLVTVLIQLDENDWKVLEKVALQMVEENRHDNKMEIAEETTPQIPSILNLPTMETDEDIEAELEDYRRQLLHEKAAAEKSRASQNSKDA